MDITIPDVTNWPEIINKRTAAITQKKEILGIERLFFHYDFQHPDPRFHKLMIRCLALYLFGEKESAKCWLVYKEENGSIKSTIYAAILMDKDNWVIGKPEMLWEAIADRDENGKLLGVFLKLETELGVKQAYFEKPINWKE